MFNRLMSKNPSAQVVYGIASFESLNAVANPIPLLAPVITAILFSITDYAFPKPS
jgi:hypothetical protein